jgi:alpha-ketoglutarate-dependent taurine dioxygenase
VAIETKPLTEHIGVEVLGLHAGDLERDDVAAELDHLLAQHGVLVFRSINIDDTAQVAFSKQLGEVQMVHNASPEFPEILVVSLDPEKSTSAGYLRGTFFWHIDGATDPIPNKATMLSAKAVASDGGETEFCSTYVAYDRLPDASKQRIEGLRVLHSFETSQALAEPDASEKVRKFWRQRTPLLQPLVWTHQDGRKSLVLGSTVTCIDGWDSAESEALLHEQHEASVQESMVYRHTWAVGDLVIWDNRGTMHRAVPYATDSPRVMHRTTIIGDEAFN